MTIEFNKPKEIKLLDDLIYQAGEHGSDGQGWYDVNKEGLEESINDFLKFYKLDEKYKPYFHEKQFIGIIEKNFFDDFINQIKKLDKGTFVYLSFTEYQIIKKLSNDDYWKPVQERNFIFNYEECCVEYKGIKIREKK